MGIKNHSPYFRTNKRATSSKKVVIFNYSVLQVTLMKKKKVQSHQFQLWIYFIQNIIQIYSIAILIFPHQHPFYRNTTYYMSDKKTSSHKNVSNFFLLLS